MSEKVHVLVRLRNADPPESSAWSVRGSSLVHRTTDTEQVVYSCFDTVLENVTNEDLYCRHMRPFVVSCLEGTSCVVFAYGQTGSGKTHTILGSSSEQGLVQLSIADLFDRGATEVTISYVEIYNEKIFDLISPERAVRLLDAAGTPRLSNATEVAARSREEALLLVESCRSNRKTGATEFNQRSSRSHTVFTAVIAGPGAPGRLCLIDLAGSEKAAGAQERRMEGSFINRSLLALGKVVDSMSRNSFVCFRDSKLTRILQPSLDGNTKLVALCMISPLRRCEEESISTLGFAARLGRMKLETRCERVGSADAAPAPVCRLCRSPLLCAEDAKTLPGEPRSTAGEDTWPAQQGGAQCRDACNAQRQNQFLLQMLKLYEQRVEHLEKSLLSVYAAVSRKGSGSFSIEKNLFDVRRKLLEKTFQRPSACLEDGPCGTARGDANYPQ